MGGVVPVLGHVRLCDLIPQMLSDFYRDSLATELTMRGATEAEKEQGGKPISPTTVHHRHVALKMAMKDAVKKHRLITFNPADDAVAPTPGKPALRVLDEKDARAMLAALTGTSSDLLAFVALLHRGATRRTSEPSLVRLRRQEAGALHTPDALGAADREGRGGDVVLLQAAEVRRGTRYRLGRQDGQTAESTQERAVSTSLGDTRRDSREDAGQQR